MSRFFHRKSTLCIVVALTLVAAFAGSAVVRGRTASAATRVNDQESGLCSGRKYDLGIVRRPGRTVGGLRLMALLHLACANSIPSVPTSMPPALLRMSHQMARRPTGSRRYPPPPLVITSSSSGTTPPGSSLHPARPAQGSVERLGLLERWWQVPSPIRVGCPISTAPRLRGVVTRASRPGHLGGQPTSTRAVCLAHHLSPMVISVCS